MHVAHPFSKLSASEPQAAIFRLERATHINERTASSSSTVSPVHSNQSDWGGGRGKSQHHMRPRLSRFVVLWLFFISARLREAVKWETARPSRADGEFSFTYDNYVIRPRGREAREIWRLSMQTPAIKERISFMAYKIARPSAKMIRASWHLNGIKVVKICAGEASSRPLTTPLYGIRRSMIKEGAESGESLIIAFNAYG